jgi:hypothetical protein
MNDNEQNLRDGALDDALATLSADIEPSRDLWPDIRASVETTPLIAPSRRPAFGLWMQLAAGFVLVIATAATTYVVTRHSLEQQPQANVAAQTAQNNASSSNNATSVVPVSSSDGEIIAAEYLRSRAELDRLFAQRVASLPPATRAKLQSNLADLRRAADEIVANLSQHPSDPLLHELLMSTYQSEAQLLADVGAMPQSDSKRNPS